MRIILAQICKHQARMAGNCRITAAKGSPIMNAKQLATLLLAATTLSASLAPTVAQAHDDDVVIGALIGGIAGAAIGSNMGGRNSALVGAAIGSVTGAAIGSSNSNRHPAPPPVAYRAPVAYAVQPVSYPQVVAYEDRHEWREHRHERHEHRGWRERQERRENGREHDRGYTYPPSGY